MSGETDLNTKLAPPDFEARPRINSLFRKCYCVNRRYITEPGRTAHAVTTNELRSHLAINIPNATWHENNNMHSDDVHTNESNNTGMHRLDRK